jgi:hypothetical protein
MKLRELLTKIELKLRPVQLGKGQRELDDVDGLATTSEARKIEKQQEERPL